MSRILSGGGSQSQHTPQVKLPGGLCPGGSLRGSLFRGVCPGRSLSRESLARGSLSRGGSVQGVSVWGTLSRGVSVRETPRQRPPYGNEAGGMHPTGMHSCFEFFLENINPFCGANDTHDCTSGHIFPGFQGKSGFLPCVLPHLHAVDSSDSPLV